YNDAIYERTRFPGNPAFRSFKFERQQKRHNKLFEKALYNNIGISSKLERVQVNRPERSSIRASAFKFEGRAFKFEIPL
ncbi:MAG: hypothetical protein KJ645_07135, partial [Planctomycetes bacterium]|nr:hypothetical protein [Planctomycetota bacterium]